MKKIDYVTLIESIEDKEKKRTYEYQLLLPIGAQIDEAIEVVMKFLKVLQIDRDKALESMEKKEEQAVEVEDPPKE